MADFKLAAIHVPARTPDYIAELDEYRREREDGSYDQMVIVHIKVINWTKRVLRDCLAKWKIFRSCVTCDLYATADVETPKWHKFVRRFGFTPLRDVVTVSGEPRKMYIHRTHHGRQLNSID